MSTDTGRGPATGVARDGARRARRRLIVLALARTALTVVAVLVLYYVLPLDRGFHPRTLVALFLGLVAFAALVTWQVRGILRSSAPALRAVESVALTVPLFLVVFAAVYVVLAQTDPGSFTEPLTRTDSLYFVVTVFATVGFGDISPVTELARAMVTVQMVCDLLLIGLVLRVFLTAVNSRRGVATPPDPLRE
jgi:voltage-gated potassium channel